MSVRYREPHEATAFGRPAKSHTQTCCCCSVYVLHVSFKAIIRHGIAVFGPFLAHRCLFNRPPLSVNARAPVNASRRPLTRRRASTDTPRRSTEYYVRYHADFIANGRRRTANVLLPPPLGGGRRGTWGASGCRVVTNRPGWASGCPLCQRGHSPEPPDGSPAPTPPSAPAWCTEPPTARTPPLRRRPPWYVGTLWVQGGEYSE